MTQRNSHSRNLRADGLCKTYGSRQVVRGVNLSLDSGQVIGLLGPNGAGKTTTFYMVVGLTRPDGGQVWLDGDEITEQPMHQRARRGISYLPQEASVFRKLSVRDNLLAILETVEDDRELQQHRAQELLEEFGITHIADSKGFALSGGERRRVEIARALITNPRILILDEATSALDYESESILQGNMRRIWEGRTVLIIAHRLSAVRDAHRIIVLDRGQIVETGTHAALVANSGGLYAHLHRLQQGGSL